MSGSQQRRISASILLISAAGLIYYATANWADFRRLSLVAPGYLGALVVLLILEYFVIGLTIMTLTRPLGLKLGMAEAFVLSLMTGFHNLVLPFRGGMVTRAVYLKTRHNFTYTNFLASLSAGYVLTYLMASFLGMLSLLYAQAVQGVASGVLLLAFIAIFVSLLLVVLFSPQLRDTRSAWINKFIHVINGWASIKNNRRMILATAVLSLIQILLETAAVFLQFRVFGIDVSPVKSLYLASVGLLGQLIQLTPAGLGVNEALVVFSAQAIAVTLAQTLAATLLGRLVAFVALAVLGPIATYRLTRNVTPLGSAE